MAGRLRLGTHRLKAADDLATLIEWVGGLNTRQLVRMTCTRYL